MATFSKQPSESYPIAIEFTGKLPSGRSLASGIVAAIDLSDGSDASSTVLDTTTATIVGTRASRRVQAGTSGTNYKLSFTLTLDNGLDILEEDVVMRVEER